MTNQLSLGLPSKEHESMENQVFTVYHFTGFKGKPIIFGPEERKLLLEIWHVSKGVSYKRHERMLWTARWFAKKKPEYPEIAAYIALDNWVLV